MKIAISVTDGEFDRFEKIASSHGMNLSEFYGLAAKRLADELEGERELTSLSNSVIKRAGKPSGDGIFLGENARRQLESTEW